VIAVATASLAVALRLAVVRMVIVDAFRLSASLSEVRPATAG
jgi:hypothetical protein